MMMVMMMMLVMVMMMLILLIFAVLNGQPPDEGVAVELGEGVSVDRIYVKYL